jgi:hypothetical protein
MRALVVIAGLGLGSLVAACANGQSSQGGPNANDNYPDVQSFCDGLAQAECSHAVLTACGVKDSSSCAKAMSAACVAGQPQGTSYVAANAQACVELATSTYGKSTISASEKAQLATLCGPQIFSGPGGPRSPCTSQWDCSSAQGLSCVVPYGQMSGKCLAPTPVPPSGSCADEASVCSDPSYFCDPMQKECLPAANNGEACNQGWRPCVPGYTCTNGLFGTCKQLGADGAPCTLDTDCTGGMCDKASSQAEGTCASQITLTPLDSLCTPFNSQ